MRFEIITTMSAVLILDNGGCKIKYGTESNVTPQGSMTNCTARVNKQMQVLVGEQVDASFNGSNLCFSRPFEKGYLVNWACELDVWGRLFGASCLNIVTTEMALVLTEPPFNPDSIQNDTNEIVFEEYGFREYMRRPSAWFSAYEFAMEPPVDACNPSCCTVVDSGFSFSHSLPFISSRCRKQTIKRVNVGGKLLTNYLKEVVSYRQWNMMDEFKLIDQVKEDLCYISTDAINEIKASKKSKRDAVDFAGDPLKRSFVLPDFSSIMKGYVKPVGEADVASEQLLYMETERFSIPEVLFHPSDVGIEQAGIAEATWQSLSGLDQVEMGLAAANIVLTGGNANFPQYKERFMQELRPLVPDIIPINIFLPTHPEDYAWNGAARFVRDEKRLFGDASLSRHMVSRSEYLESGHYYCNKKMDQSW